CSCPTDPLTPTGEPACYAFVMNAQPSRALDPDGVLRVVAELCAVLRRRGVPVAPHEVADAARALALLGLDRRDVVREALAATLVKRQAQRPIFDEVFRGFFDPTVATPIDLFDRLRAEGFTDDEIETLQEALAAATEG